MTKGDVIYIRYSEKLDLYHAYQVSGGYHLTAFTNRALAKSSTKPVIEGVPMPLRRIKLQTLIKRLRQRENSMINCVAIFNKSLKNPIVFPVAPGDGEGWAGDMVGFTSIDLSNFTVEEQT